MKRTNSIDDKKRRIGKKQYVRPEIISERIYEENALACGKNPNVSRTAPCRLNAQS